MKKAYYKYPSESIMNMKSQNCFIFPLELKYRLNYFGFYSDKMTKKAMDSVKTHQKDKNLFDVDN